MNRRAAIVCRGASIEEIYALRFAVLRSGEAPVKLYFAGDEKGPPETWHFGAFTETGENVGCLTLFASQFEGAPAIQLRGMAVAESWRSAGVGAELLLAAEEELKADPRVAHWSWWCNARSTAVRFYERNGWRIVSEEFVIEKYGPHRRMVKDASESAKG